MASGRLDRGAGNQPPLPRGDLQEAIARFGIAEDQIRLLQGFESYIYEFTRADGAFILRIGHSRRRSVDLIRGEVDWINVLAAGGAGVARAILSQQGALVEAIDDGEDGQFLATAFVRAQGRPVWEVGWTPQLYERYGELLGRIHAISKTYTPGEAAWRRPEWDSPDNLETEKWLPPQEAGAVARFREIKAYLDALLRGPDWYGLIHQDAHSGNFFVDDEERLTLFDFDDCVYGWYIYDVAMVVFYRIVTEAEPLKVTQAFMPAFWRGYRREMALDPAWLAEIPAFMRLREVDLYGVLYRSFGDLDRAEIDDGWIKHFLVDRRRRIEDAVPIVDYDFRALAEQP